MWYARYLEYLQSPEWAEIRRKRHEIDGWRCRLCNTQDDLECHHRTYERLGREDVNDLTTLCRRCHEVHTSEIRSRKYKSSKLSKVKAVVQPERNLVNVERPVVPIELSVRVTDAQRTSCGPPESAFEGNQEGCGKKEENRGGSRAVGVARISGVALYGRGRARDSSGSD